VLFCFQDVYDYEFQKPPLTDTKYVCIFLSTHTHTHTHTHAHTLYNNSISKYLKSYIVHIVIIVNHIIVEYVCSNMLIIEN